MLRDLYIPQLNISYFTVYIYTLFPLDKKPVIPFGQGRKVARVLLFPVRTVSETVFKVKT